MDQAQRSAYLLRQVFDSAFSRWPEEADHLLKEEAMQERDGSLHRQEGRASHLAFTHLFTRHGLRARTGPLGVRITERKGILLSVHTLLATVVFWSGELTRSPGLVAAGSSSRDISAPTAQATRSGVRN